MGVEGGFPRPYPSNFFRCKLLKPIKRPTPEESRGEGQWKESADKKGGPAGLKLGPQQKRGLVGKRKLQPYAPHGTERTN